MKTCGILQLLIITFLFGCNQETEKFTFQPDNPQPGEQIHISYNPSGTKLSDANEITLLAYSFPEKMPIVEEVIMQKRGANWIGSFTTTDTTLTVFPIFISGERKDDNDGNGYLITLFTDEKTPVKGAMARQAKVRLNGGAYPFRLQRSFEKAFYYYQKEFEFYPEQKQNWEMVKLYWWPFVELHKDSASVIIQSQLDELLQKEEKTIEELGVLISGYAYLNQEELKEKYLKELINKEPKGYVAEYQRFLECYLETAIIKKRELILAFQNDFQNGTQLMYLHDQIIANYTGKGQYGEALAYLNCCINNPSPYILNSLARKMIENEIMLDSAIKLAQEAMIKTRLKQDSAKKPNHYTQKQWKEEKNHTLADILDTYGFGLFKTGEIEESVVVLQEATDLYAHKNNRITKHYCHALYQSGEIEKAFIELEALVRADPVNQEVRDFFKEVYINYKGSEDGLESFFAMAKKAYRIQQQEELKEQMLDLPAPAFTLYDLDSNAISLSDFKGKIVVLDFWATWCEPCVESFPAMQRSVDKYNDKVKYLFIDTWEKEDDADRKVKDFIEETKYTFHVLRDVKNSVVKDYKVFSIPTKLIIDQEGNIRFRSEGYGGDDDKLIEELDLMIDLLQQMP